MTNEYPVRDRYLESQEERLGRNYEDLADGLKRLGERIRLEGGQPLTKVGIDQFNAHTYQAAGVLHTLIWGIANLNIERILNAARDADYAARQAVEEQAPTRQDASIYLLTFEPEDEDVPPYVTGLFRSKMAGQTAVEGLSWVTQGDDEDPEGTDPEETGPWAAEIPGEGTYVLERRTVE